MSVEGSTLDYKQFKFVYFFSSSAECIRQNFPQLLVRFEWKMSVEMKDECWKEECGNLPIFMIWMKECGNLPIFTICMKEFGNLPIFMDVSMQKVSLVNYQTECNWDFTITRSVFVALLFIIGCLFVFV